MKKKQSPKCFKPNGGNLFPFVLLSIFAIMNFHCDDQNLSIWFYNKSSYTVKVYFPIEGVQDIQLNPGDSVARHGTKLIIAALSGGVTFSPGSYVEMKQGSCDGGGKVTFYDR